MHEMKRPLGLTLISIFWFLGSLYNFIVGLRTIKIDLDSMPLLSDPSLPQWFQFGLPAELALGIFVVIFASVQLLTIYGLLTRKAWSYKLALTVPVLVIISWCAQVALYTSAPPSLGLVTPSLFLGLGAGIFWLCLFWSYLRRPLAKQYLLRTPSKTTPQLQNPITPVSSTVDSQSPRWTQFVRCPGCGHQNRLEANYCEKCGQPRSQMRETPSPPPP